jgi:hypothetical protein
MKYQAAILRPLNGADAGPGAIAAAEFHNLNF